jgi:hypothetical protein
MLLTVLSNILMVYCILKTYSKFTVIILGNKSSIYMCSHVSKLENKL